MNIFLPYEDDVVESVKALDNARLNKQIVECMAIITASEGITKGYRNHPITVFYGDNLDFVYYYGFCCCREYAYRFGKYHEMHWVLHKGANPDGKMFVKQPDYTPYYMEGSKGQPNYIRTTDNVSALFQQKLINKWNNDKAKCRPPKWTNRQVPEFYKKEIINEHK